MTLQHVATKLRVKMFLNRLTVLHFNGKGADANRTALLLYSVFFLFLFSHIYPQQSVKIVTLM